jgi:hypothetical protein
MGTTTPTPPPVRSKRGGFQPPNHVVDFGKIEKDEGYDSFGTLLRMKGGI